MTEALTPRPSVREMQERLAAELAPGPRIAYTLLLLFDLSVGAAVASLWLTEPSLPLRTHVAFALILAIAVAWAAYFLRVLVRRKVFLAGQRVVAGRLATVFTGLFTLGALLLALLVSEQRAVGLAAAGFGAVMFAVAVTILRAARRRLDELLERRRELEAG